MHASAIAESASNSTGLLQQRVAALTAAFRLIGDTRMQDLPFLHPALQVEAVGFEAACEGALGVLITPWFMNLIWLPFDGAQTVEPGANRVRELGGERLEFIGALETLFGAYEMCSLFSPMSEFADQAAARETAVEVLRFLRRTLPKPDVPAVPSRRAFLTGRFGANGGERA